VMDAVHLFHNAKVQIPPLLSKKYLSAAVGNP